MFDTSSALNKELERQVQIQTKEINRLKKLVQTLEQENSTLRERLDRKKVFKEEPLVPALLSQESEPESEPEPELTVLPIKTDRLYRTVTVSRITADDPPSINPSKIGPQDLNDFWHWLSLKYGTRFFRVVDICATLNITDRDLKKLLSKLQDESLAAPEQGEGKIIDYMSRWRLLETTSEAVA